MFANLKRCLQNNEWTFYISKSAGIQTCQIGGSMIYTPTMLKCSDRVLNMIEQMEGPAQEDRLD